MQLGACDVSLNVFFLVLLLLTSMTTSIATLATGNTLGSTTDASAAVGHQAANARAPGEALPKYTITFYKDGFTCDNGTDEAPLRSQ